jgi:hypothetical protein
VKQQAIQQEGWYITKRMRKKNLLGLQVQVKEVQDEMTHIVNKIKVMQFKNKNYGNFFVDKGSRFEVGHHRITWSDGENEKHGALLFLPLIVRV